MKTITAAASPVYTSALNVALRNENAIEVHPCDVAQTLLNNDAHAHDRINRSIYQASTIGTNSTWSLEGAGTFNLATALRLTATANCDLQLLNTGASASGGQRLEVRTEPSSYNITIKDASGSTMVVHAGSGAAISQFIFTGAQWILWGKLSP
jgi:hypothetical protein